MQTNALHAFEPESDSHPILQSLLGKTCQVQSTVARTLTTCRLKSLDINARTAHVKINDGRVEAPVRLGGIKKMVIDGVHIEDRQVKQSIVCTVGDEVIYEGDVHDVHVVEGDTLILSATDPLAIFVPKERSPQISALSANERQFDYEGPQAISAVEVQELDSGSGSTAHETAQAAPLEWDFSLEAVAEKPQQPVPEQNAPAVESAQTVATQPAQSASNDDLSLDFEWNPDLSGEIKPRTTPFEFTPAPSASQLEPRRDESLVSLTPKEAMAFPELSLVGDEAAPSSHGNPANKEEEAAGVLDFADSIINTAADKRTSFARRPMREVKLREVKTAEDLLDALEEQKRSPIVRIGEALCGLGFITPQQLDEALESQRGGPSVQLGELLIREKLITKDELRLALAAKLAYPVVDVQHFPLEADVFRRLPIEKAFEHRCVPLMLHQGRLIIAADNPSGRHLQEDIEFNLQCKLSTVMARHALTDAVIQECYERFGLGKPKEDSSHHLLEELDTAGSEDDGEDIEQNDNSLVKLINAIVIEAHELGASDIHFETYPGKRKMRIRLRKDGRMFLHMELPHTYNSAVISRLKIMADLDISEKRQSQDGKINFARYSPQHPIELRVSTVPTIGGAEDVVLRLLTSSRPLPLPEIGLSPQNMELVQAAIERPHGMILCVGPTGSGKTTTLHAMLGAVNAPDRKIWTAEDPVEITHPDFRQVQVNHKINWSFAKALRAFLRSDPDVIMVGEIRDEETARVAIEASLTGHLVLSTLHTNSAAETVTRLLDMGMDPFNFSDSLQLVIAQRLVRKVCPSCVRHEAVSEHKWGEILTDYLRQFPDDVRPSRETADADLRGAYADEQGRIMRPVAVGCKKCHDTGYRGRIGVHEVLSVDRSIRRLIQNKALPDEIQAEAFGSGHFRTLRQDGLHKMLQGLTTLEEVRSNTA